MPFSTTESLHAAIGGALSDVPGAAFAVVFGSSVRGTAHTRSDVDVALGFGHGRRPAAREIVTLNLFVALQECLSLASHWLADEGWEVPGTYAEVFRVLAERNVLDHDLAARMAGAAGLRNLIAHRYGAPDWTRIHDIASHHIEDLPRFCDVLADGAGDRS